MILEQQSDEYLLQLIDKLKQGVANGKAIGMKILEEDSQTKLDEVLAILQNRKQAKIANVNNYESPKIIAPPTASSSGAITPQKRQLQKNGKSEKPPMNLTQKTKGNSAYLKVSSHFSPKSRFTTYQKTIRVICRYLKQYNNLKPNTKNYKREVYRTTLLNLCDECMALVNSSVAIDFRARVLQEKYKAWGSDNVFFTLGGFEVFLKKYLS